MTKSIIDSYYRTMYDLELRECIGKTDDDSIPLCAHANIVAREMANKGVIVCRVCNKPLPEGEGRYNDHKVIRNPMCVQPICTKCADENPDAFYLAFKKGIRIMHAFSPDIHPLYIECARMAIDIERVTCKNGVIGKRINEELGGLS